MIYRRVLPSEVNQVSDLCSRTTEWEELFPSHQIWLDKALKSLDSKERVVFGAFDLATANKDNLVGCLFLKRSSYSYSKGVVLKNFLVSPDTTDSEIIRKNLLQKVIRFCESREINRVEIELPHVALNHIQLFLHEGYRLVSVRERAVNNQFLILERKLGGSYQSDPFDYESICKWMTEKLLPDAVFTDFDLEGKCGPDFCVYSASKKLQNLEIILKFIVDGNPDVNATISVISEIFQTKNQEYRYLISNRKFSAQQRRKLKALNISHITPSMLTQILGPDASTNLPICYEEVGGLISVLEKQKIEKLRHQSGFLYYLISGLGEAVDHDQYLLIYCPDWIDANGEITQGIVGYALIREVNTASYDTAIKNFDDESGIYRLLSKDDLSLYKIFSKNNILRKLYCEKIQLCTDAIAVKDGYLSSDAVAEYINSEIGSNVTTNTYIDEASVKEIVMEISAQNSSSDQMRLPALSEFIQYLSERICTYDEASTIICAPPINFPIGELPIPNSTMRIWWHNTLAKLKFDQKYLQKFKEELRNRYSDDFDLITNFFTGFCKDG